MHVLFPPPPSPSACMAMLYIIDVQAQPSRAAIQPEFLSYRVDNASTWDPTFLRGVFCLVGQKTRID